MAYQKCSSLFLLPKLENSIIFSSECLPGTAEASMLVQRAGRHRDAAQLCTYNASLFQVWIGAHF